MYTIKQMPCFVLTLLGLTDWFTTVVGVTCFGAVEGNPLFTCLTQTNLIAFSALKIASVLVIGFLFYKAFQLEKTSKVDYLGKLFLYSAYFISLAVLCFVVLNNFAVVVGI